MSQFVRIEVWTALQCQPGAVRLGVLYPGDLVSAKDVLAIDDQESLTFSFPRYDRTGVVRPVVSKIVGRTIATVIWSDGSFDERRVAMIEDGRGVGGLVTVTANPLILDLAEAADSSTGKGFISTTAGALRVFSFALSSQSATSIFDTYIIPACPSYVSRGTIDPTAKIASMTWDRQTPQAVALQVRDELRKRNVSCELRLRRNGTTDYKLDLVTQIGAGAAVPLFHPRTSLRSLKRRAETAQQATRLFVKGQADPSGLPGIPGRARWLVTAVDGTAKTLTLADPNGASGPVGMTGQWVGAYALRVKTGRTFPVQASTASAQTVTLLDVSTFAAGELIEFRLTEPLTNTIRRAATSPRFAVSSVGGSSEYLALAGSPIATDGQHTDWYARVWTAASGGTVRKSVRVSGSVASTSRALCAAGAAAGVLTTDYVEFIQLDGAGELPSYLEHATYVQPSPVGFGVKCGDLAAGTPYGVTNLVRNSWLRSWATPTAAPDDWTLAASSGSPGASSQNTDPLYSRYGGVSYLVDFTDNVLQAPALYTVNAFGNSRVSIRASVLFSAFSPSPADVAFALEVYALDAAGARTGALLGTSRVAAPGSATTLTQVPTGAWVTLELAGLDLTPYEAPYGIGIYLGAPSGGTHFVSGQCVAYVDAVEAYGFQSNPPDVFEFGDATALHQSANRQLLANGAPLMAYELTVADLERSDPTIWSRNALSIGGTVRAVDTDLGADVSVRLLRLERDLLSPQASVVGLATLPVLLTQQTVAGASSTTSTTSATSTTTSAATVGGSTAPSAFLQVGTGAVSRSLQDKAAERFTGRDFAMIGNGTTGCSTQFANADAARLVNGGAIVLTAGRYLIEAATTIYSPVLCEPGAVLVVAAGVTLQLRGQFIGDPSQHFDTTASGAVVTIATFSTERIYPQWWNGTWDGAADDHASLQRAIDAVDTAGGKGGVVTLPPCGVGLGSTGITGRTNVQIQGAGRRSTFLNYTGSGSAVTFTDVQLCGLSGCRINPGTSGSAKAISVLAVAASCLELLFDDLELASSSVAGQIGIYEMTTGLNIISECKWSRVNIDGFDLPVYQRGPEGNTFKEFQISRFGTVGGSSVAWNAVTNVNFIQARISGVGPGVTATYGLVCGGARNISHLVCDFGGTAAYQDVGARNEFFVQRAEGATPLGAPTATGLVIDPEHSTLPRFRAAGSPLTAGDFILAGFGSSATVTNIRGTDQRFSFEVNAIGGSITANPTISLTFHDGAWPSAPFALVTRNGGSQITAPIIALPSAISTTGLQLIFVGTPVAGESYSISGLLIG